MIYLIQEKGKKGIKKMRKVAKLNTNEYVNLIAKLPEEEAKAKRYCKRHNIDFEDVKTYDWGFEWQD